MADMGNIVLPEQLQDALDDIFAEYTGEIVNGMDEVVTKTMKELVNETKEAKASHPGRRDGAYFDSIASKKLNDSRSKLGKILAIDVSRVWFVNSPNYRLSHLLNNGHALHHGGRYAGDPFITRAHDKAVEAYERRTMEVIERAGN